MSIDYSYGALRFAKELRNLDYSDLPLVLDDITEWGSEYGLGVMPTRRGYNLASDKDIPIHYLAIYWPAFLKQATLPSKFAGLSTSAWVYLRHLVKIADNPLYDFLNNLLINRASDLYSAEAVEGFERAMQRLAEDPVFIRHVCAAVKYGFHEAGFLGSNSSLYRDIRNQDRFCWGRHTYSILYLPRLRRDYRRVRVCGDSSLVKGEIATFDSKPLKELYAVMHSGSEGVSLHRDILVIACDELLSGFKGTNDVIGGYRKRFNRSNQGIDIGSRSLRQYFEKLFGSCVIHGSPFVTDPSYQVAVDCKRAANILMKRAYLKKPKQSRTPSRRPHSGWKPLECLELGEYSYELVPVDPTEGPEHVRVNLGVCYRNGEFWLRWPAELSKVLTGDYRIPREVRNYGAAAYFRHAGIDYINEYGLGRRATVALGAWLKNIFVNENFAIVSPEPMTKRAYDRLLLEQRTQMKREELTVGKRQHLGPFMEPENEIILKHYKLKMSDREIRHLQRLLPGRSMRAIKKQAQVLAERVLSKRGWKAYKELQFRPHYGDKHLLKMKAKYPHAFEVQI